MKKTVFIISLLLTLKFIVSCVPCSCGPTYNYNVLFDATEVIPKDLSGFYPEEFTDTVYYNAFGLDIIVNGVEERMDYANMLHSLQTSIASYAWSCDCAGNQYQINNPISSVRIFVADDNKIVTDVTQNFRTDVLSEDGYLPIDTFVQQEMQYVWGAYFYLSLKLEKWNNIPPKAQFIVEVELADGTTLVSNSADVVFHGS